MSISPYTMETLYSHGSIDYIPYDALAPIAISPRNLSRENYALGNSFVGQSQTGNTQTQDIAQLQMQELQRMSQAPITLYPKTTEVNNKYKVSTNYNSADSFSYSNSSSPLGEMSGSVVDEIRSIKTQPISYNDSRDSFGSGVLSAEDKKGTQKPLEGAKVWPKAFISLTAIGLTLFALFKGGKAISSSSSGFWAKLNPKNWF